MKTVKFGFISDSIDESEEGTQITVTVDVYGTENGEGRIENFNLYDEEYGVDRTLEHFSKKERKYIEKCMEEIAADKAYNDWLDEVDAQGDIKYQATKEKKWDGM